MKWFWRGLAWLDYAVLLPTLARIPVWISRPISAFRGLINAIFDWDWRTLSLGHGYVRNGTYRSMKMMSQLSRQDQWIWWLTLRRYICMSREEVDSCRLNKIDYSNVQHRFQGLQHLIQAREEKTGVVLMTAHFDSLYIGLVLLARAGICVNLMSTRITDDPQVPSAISRHFAQKRASLNALLSPGKVVHYEDSIQFFIKALRRGEIVVIACDNPATSAERSQPVRFMGHDRLMAAGPLFLAQTAKSPVALYTCKEIEGAHFEIEITKPELIERGGLQQVYSALEARLLAQPWRWWSADLLSTYSRV